MNIDVELVRRLVAEQFPRWADLPVRPVETQGWDNRTFRLGPDKAVRLPSARWYAAQVEKEQTWLPRLAPGLPLPIPQPLAVGAPGAGYAWPWSIYRWLEGEPATKGNIADLTAFAVALAGFLVALQRIDTADAPAAGRHSFWRGAPLAVYDTETREAIATLDSRIDAGAALEVWNAALQARAAEAPVWFHGDVAAGNLLVRGGRLAAVIDFGACGVGDPACDLVIAWTLFEGESREAFRSALSLTDAAWARGRGWALWKALIVLAELNGVNPAGADQSAVTLEAVLEDHRRAQRG